MTHCLTSLSGVKSTKSGSLGIRCSTVENHLSKHSRHSSGRTFGSNAFTVHHTSLHGDSSMKSGLQHSGQGHELSYEVEITEIGPVVVAGELCQVFPHREYSALFRFLS
ncbi:hypothetical protein AVEN_59001-1 [Araneus ventricosus]|uniref:Uncharacterized protein n=1 Tax=Araneus ventricosus TaxID=182803 RepID=A0A4Y2EGX5_ARAVE|nr:hypothetical protein AVEN_59001-1 [Araneus ventricosus]